MLKPKIHRATVTTADLDYVGSVTIDTDLMRAADLLPHEQVHVLDVSNAARLETYVIPGEAGSGVIGINGAAAHLVHPGDVVIIVGYATVPDAEAPDWSPTVVHVDPHNRSNPTGGTTAEEPSTWAFGPHGPPRDAAEDDLATILRTPESVPFSNLTLVPTLSG